MPITLCPDTLMFVEGTMERAFINRKFPKITVIPVENGGGWNTNRLCAQIISKYNAKKIFPGQVIVWFDRERNDDTVNSITIALQSAFELAGYPSNQVHCLIPDRMSENIILSDEVLMAAEIGDANYTYAGDGYHGKGRIKELYKQAGKDFKETTHGSRLLEKVKLSRCAEKNSSVALFLSTFTIPCWIV